MDEDGSLPEHRFRRLFETNSRALLAFALRRTPSPADAADVVAETMLVAWRRLEDVPAGEETRLWLFGVARRVVANHDRGVLRRDRLASRLGECLEQAVEQSRDESVVVGVVLADAMQALDQSERELLQLTAWEGLSPAEIAVVLDVPAATVRSRLHRARTKLRSILANSATGQQRTAATGHVDGESNPTLRSITGDVS